MSIRTAARERARLAFLVLLAVTLPCCGQAEQGSQKLPRVVLIGIDALGWEDFSTLLRQGRLPHLKSLVDEGVVGELFNFPGGQKEQWASVATGLRPVLLFPQGWWAKPLEDIEPAAQPRMAAFQGVAITPIWQILSSAGARVGVSGWEVSSRGDIDGYEAQFHAFGRRGVSAGASQATLFEKKSAPNWVATTYASPDTGLFRPPDFYETVREGIVTAENQDDAYFLAALPSLRAIQKENKTLFLDVKYALVSTLLSRNIASVLLADRELSFVGSIIWGLDPVAHRADRRRSPQLRIEAHQFIDRVVGDLLAAVDEQTFVFVVSNHSVGRRRGHNMHSTDAVFIARGPGIKRNEFVVGAGIADVGPTVLRTFGVEIEDPIDGRPMTSVFTEAFLKENPVSRKVSLSSYPASSTGEGGDRIDEAAIEKATLDRMVKIGYSPHQPRP